MISTSATARGAATAISSAIADGATTNFTPSTGTNHAALVDESPPNDDTDYNQSSNVGDLDLYEITDMAHTPASIFGVQINLNAKKDDAGTRSIAGVVRSGGTNYEGGAQALSTSYAYYLDVRETDPDTSAPWTKTGVDNAQFGIKVTA